VALHPASDVTRSLHLMDDGLTYACGPATFATGEHEEPADILET